MGEEGGLKSPDQFGHRRRRIRVTRQISQQFLYFVVLLWLILTLSVEAESASLSTPGDDSAANNLANKNKFFGRRRGKPRHILLVSINELAHIKPLTALGREFIRRGHTVTFVAPESCLLGTNTSSCFIKTSDWMKTYIPKATYMNPGETQSSVERETAAPMDLPGAVSYALSTVANVNDIILRGLLDHYLNPENQAQSIPRPDVMVADFLTTAAIDAAEALKLPLIVNNPFPICHDLTEPQGILVPVHAFPAPLKSLRTLKGRLANLINHLLWMFVGLYAAKLRNVIRSKYHLPALPYIRQLTFRASPLESQAWILQNTFFGLEVPRVLDARTHMVGPLFLPEASNACYSRERDCRAALAWLNRKSARHRGVIYVNLATPLSPAPLPMVQNVIRALASDQISQYFDVLWVLDDVSRSRLERLVPPHLLIVPAAPHLAVLHHPRVKVIMSQSSLEVLTESLFQGVPLIGLPLRGYDRGACTLAQDAKAALCLAPKGRRSWSLPEVVVEAVLEVTGVDEEDESMGSNTCSTISPYQENARRLSSIIQASGGVSKAGDLVELAMQVGLGHLEEPNLHLSFGLGTSWMSGSMADVRLLIFLLVLLIYWTLALTLRLLRRTLRSVHYAFKNLQFQETEEQQQAAPLPAAAAAAAARASTASSGGLRRASSSNNQNLPPLPPQSNGIIGGSGGQGGAYMRPPMPPRSTSES